MDSIDLNFENNSTDAGRFYLHFTEGMIPELPTDGMILEFKVQM